MSTIALILSLGGTQRDGLGSLLWDLGVSLYLTVIVGLVVLAAIPISEKNDAKWGRPRYRAIALATKLPLLVFIAAYELSLRPHFKSAYATMFAGRELPLMTRTFLEYLPSGIVGLFGVLLIVAATIGRGKTADSRLQPLLDGVMSLAGSIIVAIIPLSLMAPLLL